MPKSYADEDVGSDEEPTIKVRDSQVNTLNNVMISHEKEKFKATRQKSLKKVEQERSSEDDDSEEASESKGSDHSDNSDNSDNSESQQQNSDEEESIGGGISGLESSHNDNEVYTSDGPVQLVKVSDDLSTFEV